MGAPIHVIHAKIWYWKADRYQKHFLEDIRLVIKRRVYFTNIKLIFAFRNNT